MSVLRAVARSRRPRVRGAGVSRARGAGAAAPLAGLVLALALPSPARAWSPASQQAIAEQAALIAPPDLRRQIARHAAEYRGGAAAPFEGTAGADHVKFPDGSGRLDRTIAERAAAAVEAIRSHQPFDQIVYLLGVVSHYTADANNPLYVANGDSGQGAWGTDYLRYLDSARPRFSVVFYGRGRDLGSSADLAAMVERSIHRARGLYPSVVEEYRRIGGARGVELFDDRSTAFGVGSLAFSHAVSDAAAVLRYIWIEAGGDDPRRLPISRGDTALAAGSSRP